MNGFTSGYHAANGQQHSPRDWFTRGAYPSCSCGFTPNNNRALAEHWSANGMRWIDDHGTLRPEFDVTANRILVELRQRAHSIGLDNAVTGALLDSVTHWWSGYTMVERAHAKRVLRKLEAQL